ncbi:hypothetical protein ACQCLI_18335 [Pseudomonas nitroreducens]|uniref:hypothetical protein n=1 Tax=Pseudomonas nitroreducens TaxID=46680 RepID=UPI00037F86CD|nr:hypothetical protein [Pseudomonas nitroreducens]
METDFPEIEERFAADAWREPVYVEHRITHEDLQAATEAWLKEGNEITTVESGLQTATKSEFNGRIVGGSDAAQKAAENQNEAARDKQSKRSKKDMQVCEALVELLPEKLGRAAFAKRLGIKDSVLQRILRTYFPKDSRFDYLRPVQRKIGPMKTLEEAFWILAKGRIAIVDGVSMKRCSLCKQAKPVTEFFMDGSKASGFASRCTACEKAIYGMHDGIRTRIDQHERAAA